MEDILLNNFKHTEKSFEQLFEFLPIGMAMIDFETGKFLEVNQSLLKTTGYTKEEFLNLDFWDITPSKYEKQEKQQIEDLKKYQKFGPNEKEYIKKDGTKYPIKISGFLITKDDGREVVWGLIEDITLTKQHEIIYEDNKSLLEYIAIENSLDKTLNKIVTLAEKRNQQSMCSILLLDKEKKHLFTACAPSLPEFYTKAINGVEIGEKVGSCGSASFKKQRVIVENIDTHENWQDYLELTNKANLHSCWSEPIVSSENEILGSFAIYTNSHKYPSEFEIKLIETYANLTSKAIEKDTNTKKILEREMELEQLFNNTQIGLMYVSSNRKLIKANQKLTEIFGYDNDTEMIGINIIQLHLSEKKFNEFREKCFNILKNGNKLDLEYQFQKKDKSIIWCEMSGKAIDSQDFSKGAIWMVKDISLRKKREQELKKLNQKTTELVNEQQVLLSLFDKGDTVLFKWRNDEKWSIEYLSSSVEKLFAYKKEEFLSQKIDYSSCIHKDDIDNVGKEVQEALEYNLDYFKHKPYRIITKDANVKWVLDNTVTLKNEKNEIISFIGYIIDITEQIKNQELIFHQSKIASMGEMLGNISHQWRQPLSAISTLATGSKLKKEVEILDDFEFYENMDLINNNAQYLSKTIDDFRNFFTSDASTKKEINLKNTFDTIYSLIKDSFKSSDIQIIFDLLDTKLLINENIFIQAMINILNNARDAFAQNNSIDKYVFVNLIQNEKEYFLTITDNAGGIPENIKEKIFEPYFTTKHKSQGTGIGLYMTNQIITKQLKGDILVRNVKYLYENKEFHGACFEIKIPI